jgi:hypothetical protein
MGELHVWLSSISQSDLSGISQRLGAFWDIPATDQRLGLAPTPKGEGLPGIPQRVSGICMPAVSERVGQVGCQSGSSRLLVLTMERSHVTARRLRELQRRVDWA